MKMKGLILILIFHVRLISLFAQNFTPIFENISDELPSSEVHDIYQDSIGYLWFATDRGIVRYDGQNYIRLKTDLHFSAATFRFFKETNEKIWFNTSENKLYWFNPKDNSFEITPYKYNKTLIQTIGKIHYKEFIRNIEINENGCKVSFLNGTGYVKVYSNGLGYVKNRVKVIHHSHLFSNLYIHYNPKFTFTEFEKSNRPSSVFLIDKLDTIQITNDFLFKKLWLYGVSDICINDKKTLILIGRYLIKIENSKITYIMLPIEGICIYSDNDQTFIGTYNGVYSIGSDLSIISKYLMNNTITSILKDESGGVWISSTQNGVFHSKNIKLNKLVSEINIVPTYMEIRKQKLCVIDNSTQLKIYDLNGSFINSFKNVYEVNYSFRTENDSLGNYLGEIFGKVNFTKLYLYLPLNRSDDFFIAENKIITRFKNNKKTILKPIEMPSMNDCALLNDSTLIICTISGLYNYNLKLNSHYRINVDKIINFKQIVPIKDDFLIISNQGLYLLSMNQLDKISSLTIGDYINGIHVQNDSVCWVYSNNGINKVEISNKNRIKITEFTKGNGLLTNEVTAITSDSNYLWIGTKKGICKLDLSSPIKKTNLELKRFILDSILVNKKSIINSKIIYIDVDTKVNLFFKYISYNNLFPPKIEYMIDNSIWTETNVNNLLIQGIGAGEHSLKIRLNSKTDQLILLEKTIIVRPPLKEQLWFVILISFLIIGLILLILRHYYRFKTRSKVKELEMLSLEIKLLTSQMNPHFTFNTISSIQHFILKNEKKEAIRYLSEFALLMRRTLDFSFTNLISINEEIDFLKLYVSLENKRFEKEFRLKIILNSECLSVKIPSLLLQPLIENVIKHANYTASFQKEIILKINNFENYIVIRIIDYGIGMLKSSYKSNHKSYGLEIIKNRVKLNNGSNYREADVSYCYTDIYKEVGTTVKIKLIKHENYTN